MLLLDSTPDFFMAIPEREKMIQDLIYCNITSVSMMCSIILPQMLQRKKGLIVNLSSMSALIPAPNFTLYSGSKAFVQKFSEDLNAEYGHLGITVQCILPGFVATNMTKMKKGSFLAPLPNQYVESALSTVGFAESTVGYLPHHAMRFAVSLISYCSPSLIRTITLKQMMNIRRRAIKKGLYTPVTED